jgi:hypothetical protein
MSVMRDAAGIDIGATQIFVAVPPDRAPEHVRSFPTFTQDLYALAEWLKSAAPQQIRPRRLLSPHAREAWCAEGYYSGGPQISTHHFLLGDYPSGIRRHPLCRGINSDSTSTKKQSSEPKPEPLASNLFPLNRRHQWFLNRAGMLLGHFEGILPPRKRQTKTPLANVSHMSHMSQKRGPNLDRVRWKPMQFSVAGWMVVDAPQFSYNSARARAATRSFPLDFNSDAGLKSRGVPFHRLRGC